LIFEPQLVFGITGRLKQRKPLMDGVLPPGEANNKRVFRWAELGCIQDHHIADLVAFRRGLGLKAPEGGLFQYLAFTNQEDTGRGRFGKLLRGDVVEVVDNKQG